MLDLIINSIFYFLNYFIFFFKFVKLKASCITAVRLIQRTKQTVYLHVKLYMTSLSIHVLQMNLLTVCVLIIKTQFTDYNNRINKHQFPLSLKLKKQLNSLFMIKKIDFLKIKSHIIMLDLFQFLMFPYIVY